MSIRLDSLKITKNNGVIGTVGNEEVLRTTISKDFFMTIAKMVLDNYNNKEIDHVEFIFSSGDTTFHIARGGKYPLVISESTLIPRGYQKDALVYMDNLSIEDVFDMLSIK